MSLSFKREFALWIVPSREGRVRRFRLSMSHVLLVTVLVSAITFMFLFMAGDYSRIQALRMKNYLMMRHAEDARTEAESEVHQLSQKVEVLQSSNHQVKAYESEIEEKVQQLSKILEEATLIGLDTKSPVNDKNIPAAEVDEGIGGLEVDCGDGDADRCEADLTEARRGPSIEDLRRLHGEAVPKGNLLGVLNSYIAQIRSMPLGFPVGGDISSGFGVRVSPFTRSLKFHKGVDFSLPQGSYIFATADGEVRTTDTSTTYGKMIDIDHGRGIVSRYAHLSLVLVNEGQHVRRGQVIGHVGSTGRSTGPHLHYEVWVDGQARNPSRFMELAYRLHQILS